MASLTITLTTDQITRVAAAYQAELPEGETADVATVKSDLIQFLVRKVHSYETAQAASVAADAVAKMDDPT